MKTHFSTRMAVTAIALLCCSLAWTGECSAQSGWSWFNQTGWFDWSDFRGYVKTRVFLAKLQSATATVRGESFSLKDDFGMTDEPEPWREFIAVLYIDRLAIRWHVEEDRFFRGRTLNQLGNTTISQLDVGGQRLGLDLDIVRYPAVRAGINFDYHTEQIKFSDRRNYIIDDPDTSTARTYYADEPLTIGIHGKAFPFRVKEVPVVIQGRFRYPITKFPLLGREHDAQIMDWEASVGLRPSVWETSLFGHSTYSVSIEVGVRSQYLTTTDFDGSTVLKASWNGAFAQFGFVF